MQKPGVYELSFDSRVKDALLAAGGLSKEADSNMVSKSLNLAAKLKDGAKIYIAYSGEPENLTGAVGGGVLGVGEAEAMVNINSASQAELDSLAGIGEVTANKIIGQRPYTDIEDLLKKKIVGQKVFDGIKSKITVE